MLSYVFILAFIPITSGTIGTPISEHTAVDGMTYESTVVVP
jgi:hypothetical protein